MAVTDDADNIWYVCGSPHVWADDISIWDWKAKTKLNKFSNKNVLGSSISSVHFINEMASSLMLTASSELSRGSGSMYLTSISGRKYSDLEGLRDSWRYSTSFYIPRCVRDFSGRTQLRCFDCLGATEGPPTRWRRHEGGETMGRDGGETSARYIYSSRGEPDGHLTR
jgi:hypothetical protein